MVRFPPRRILVAVEFSKESLYAWNAAKEIAQRFGAVLEAVWCVEPMVGDRAVLRNLARNAGYRAESVKRLRTRLGPGARLHAVNGDPVPALRRLARDRACDLLVMGARLQPGLMRWMQGSVAEAVLHDAPCAVLLVPRAWRNPRWILAPVHDASYARRGLVAAADIARAYKARLAMLEVVAKPELAPYAVKRMITQTAKLPQALFRSARPKLEVRVGNPITEILRAGRARDLIVLVAHRKSLLGDMVLGTTVERVLRHCRIPVLAIPSH